MNSTKQQYLRQIRSNTAYPTYRWIIGIIAVIGYLMAGLAAISAVISGFGALSSSLLVGLGTLVGGLLGAALMYFLVRFWKEAALIIADIGDGITDANSQLADSQQPGHLVA